MRHRRPAAHSLVAVMENRTDGSSPLGQTSGARGSLAIITVLPAILEMLATC